MRALVALNPNIPISSGCEQLGSVKMGELEIPFGLVEFDQPEFDPNTEKNEDSVLLKVNTFSCNYRDKGMLANNFLILMKENRKFVPFGSEFCATVIDKGKNVTEFEIGDKVISNCAYSDYFKNGLQPGVVTNFASLGWLRLHKSKLIKKAETFSDRQAACFSLGAQTAYGMIRRSGILESEKKQPMVFSSSSATSIFIIQILRALNIDPVCVSSKPATQKMKEVFENAKYVTNEELANYCDYSTHTFDPFFDLNLLNALGTLGFEGKYIYCGLFEQHPLLATKNITEYECAIREALKVGVLKNASVIGNCLGTTQDLKDAIELYESKNIRPIVDSEYKLEDSISFITKSFISRDKVGKCVMIYD